MQTFKAYCIMFRAERVFFQSAGKFKCIAAVHEHDWTESQWIPQTVKPELNGSYCQISDFTDDKFKDM